MLKSEFYEYAHHVIDKCFDIMEAADKEYASDADKFSNFKWQAEAEGRTAEQVAITFFLKHVRSLAKGVSIREPMEGRICDIINYALLIGGMRLEQEQSGTTKQTWGEAYRAKQTWEEAQADMAKTFASLPEESIVTEDMPFGLSPEVQADIERKLQEFYTRSGFHPADIERQLQGFRPAELKTVGEAFHDGSLLKGSLKDLPDAILEARHVEVSNVELILDTGGTYGDVSLAEVVLAHAAIDREIDRRLNLPRHTMERI